MLVAAWLAWLAGCATGLDKVRGQRDGHLEDGNFLAALGESRVVYRSGVASLSDLAAHCGLVYSVSSYSQARECVDSLLARAAASEGSMQADIEKAIAEAAAHRGALMPGVVLAAERAHVLRNGRLIEGWRDTRYGAEAALALDNLLWRGHYLLGRIELETGDAAAARLQLRQAREIVLRQRQYAQGQLALASLLDGREKWMYQDLPDAGSADSRAWWIDLLGTLSIASSLSGDTAGAAQAIDNLRAVDSLRELEGYKQSRLAFAQLAAGNLAGAKAAADADPEQTRRSLRVGGTLLGGGLLAISLLAAAAAFAAPAAGIAAAMNQVVTGMAYLIWGVGFSVLTITFSRIAGHDTAWDLTQRWYAVAKISRAAGDDDKADAMYAKLLAQDAMLQSQPAIEWQVYADHAERLESTGRDDEAIAYYEKSIAVIEATRHNIAAEAAKIGFIADKQSVYQRLMALRLKRGQVDQAFELSEQARARALLDLLATRDWTRTIDAAGAPQDELVSRIDEQQAELRLALLQDKPKEVELRRGALQRLAQRVEREAPQLAALTQVRHYTLAEIRESLQPGELLLSFAPVGERLLAFALSRTELRQWSMPAGEVTARVGLMRHAIEQRALTEAVPRELAALLFSGLPEMAHFDTLTVVPSGALHVLPFAALQGEGWLLPAGTTLRMLPSASVLPLLAERRRPAVPMRVLAFGNPDFGGRYPALPSTEAEARSVTSIVGAGRTLLGREASRDNLLQLAGDATVLHVATHGQYDAQRPLQSALMLSDGKGGAAPVVAADFYGRRIGARLVTLSACETGLGAVRSGNEVIGLYRGLMFAGADTIVASLWEVDDESTAFLMARFYRHLRDLPAPQALHRAQRDTAARWQEPYHWAGFVVIGLDRPFGRAADSAAVTPPSSATPAR